MPVFVASLNEKPPLVSAGARLVLAGTPGRLPAVGAGLEAATVRTGEGDRKGFACGTENPRAGVPAAGEGLGSPLRCAWAIAISPKTMMVASADIRRRRRFINRVPQKRTETARLEVARSARHFRKQTQARRRARIAGGHWG